MKRCDARQAARVMAAMVGLLWATAQAGECRLQPVAVQAATGKLGELTLDLGETDDPAHAQAWQGPLKITVGAAAACTADDEVSIIERPLLAGQGVLYVPTYSGSNRRLYALDVRTCRVRWSSPDYSYPLSYKDGVLKLDGHTWKLSADCLPAAKH